MRPDQPNRELSLGSDPGVVVPISDARPRRLEPVSPACAAAPAAESASEPARRFDFEAHRARRAFRPPEVLRPRPVGLAEKLTTPITDREGRMLRLVPLPPPHARSFEAVRRAIDRWRQLAHGQSAAWCLRRPLQVPLSRGTLRQRQTSVPLDEVPVPTSMTVGPVGPGASHGEVRLRRGEAARDQAGDGDARRTRGASRDERCVQLTFPTSPASQAGWTCP